MPRRSVHPARSAFTLVELVLVMVIIAIAAAVAAPRYANAAQRYRLDAAAKRIAADLEYAAAYARAKSTQQTLVFDIPGCRYTSTIPAASRPGTTIAVALDAEPYRVRLLSASFGGSATLSLTGFGIPASAGSVLIGAGSEGRRITLSADTARASITSEGIP